MCTHVNKKQDWPEREGERERESEREREGGREGEREREGVCVCERERERERRVCTHVNQKQDWPESHSSVPLLHAQLYGSMTPVHASLVPKGMGTKGLHRCTAR